MLGSFKEQQGGQCGCSTVSEEMEEDEINKLFLDCIELLSLEFLYLLWIHLLSSWAALAPFLTESGSS